MTIQTIWRIKLDDKHRKVTLSHDTANGTGYITVDDQLRQGFGPRLAPACSTYEFDIAARKCTIRILLTRSNSYRYECDINGAILVADHDRSAPALTLLRPSEIPPTTGDELLRPAGTSASTRMEELLHPLPMSTAGKPR